MSPLRAKAPRIREKRLDTIGAWLGPATTAAAEFSGDEIVQRIRTFAQSSHDDLLYALRIVATIRDSVTIIHGPRGCAAAALYHEITGSATRWAVTNLDQRDTIMGADGKLRKAVTGLNSLYRPKMIFIVANPVVAINNDDIQSVVEELHQELDLPIIPIYVTGFTSRNAVTGYDSALHALLKYLVGNRPVANRNDAVNLLSVAEHRLDREEAVSLLGDLSIRVNVLPDGADVKSFGMAAAARASIAMCPDAADYFSAILKEKYGVPVVTAPRPIGFKNTGAWLEAIGNALGIGDAAVELHQRKSEETRSRLARFSLEGVRVYLSLSAGSAFGVYDLIEELGGEVAGLTVTHLDRLAINHLQELKRRNPDLQVHVSNGQVFEEISLLRGLAPDLYVGDLPHVGQIGRLGIPVVSLASLPVIGYGGIARISSRLDAALKNPAFAASLAKTLPPYQEGWYRRSANWHIKQEVK